MSHEERTMIVIDMSEEAIKLIRTIRNRFQAGIEVTQDMIDGVQSALQSIRHHAYAEQSK